MEADTFNKNRQYDYKSILIFLVIVCAGLTISAATFYQLRNIDRAQIRSDFHHMAQMQSKAVVDQLALSMASLKSVQGYTRATANIERSQFSTFIDSIDTMSGIQALEWIPRVLNTERKQFERSVSEGQDGFAGFQISERLTQGKMVRAFERKEYFPVHLVEPLLGNEAAIGFDLGSNPARLRALNSSRDSGELYATSRITLVQERGDQYGFLVFAPVYQGGKLPITVEARRRYLKGFALGVFRIGDMMESARLRRNAEKSGVAVYLLDNTNASRQQVLFPKGDNEKITFAENEMRFEYQIRNAGRDLLLVIVPAADSGYVQQSWQPCIILIAGLLITALFSFHVFSSGNRAVYAEGLVQKRTGELQDTNRALVKVQKQLKQMALHDPLTGAPNRNLFYEQLSSTLSTAKRYQKPFVLMVIDLNKFKQINDTLGHQAGDEILRTLVTRLNSVVREGEMLARLGGDEFVILMNLNSNQSSAKRLIQRMKSVMVEPMSIDKQSVKMGLSVGVAIYPDHGMDAGILIESADNAMYAAKKSGKFFAISSTIRSVSRAA